MKSSTEKNKKNTTKKSSAKKSPTKKNNSETTHELPSTKEEIISSLDMLQKNIKKPNANDKKMVAGLILNLFNADGSENISLIINYIMNFKSSMNIFNNILGEISKNEIQYNELIDTLLNNDNFNKNTDNNSSFHIISIIKFNLKNDILNEQTSELLSILLKFTLNISHKKDIIDMFNKEICKNSKYKFLNIDISSWSDEKKEEYKEFIFELSEIGYTDLSSNEIANFFKNNNLSLPTNENIDTSEITTSLDEIKCKLDTFLENTIVQQNEIKSLQPLLESNSKEDISDIKSLLTSFLDNKETKDLKTTIETQRIEIENLKSQLESNSDILEIKSLLTSFVKENKESDTEISKESKSKSKDLEKINKKAEKTIEKQEAEINELNDKITAFTEKESKLIEKYTKKIDTKEKEIETLKSQLETANNNAYEYEKAKKDAENNLATAEDKIKDLDSRLERMVKLNEVTSEQKVIDLRNSISKKLQLEYNDFQESLDAPCNEDEFEAYRLSITKIFKALSKLGVDF